MITRESEAHAPVLEQRGVVNVAPDIAIVFGPQPPKRSKLRRCPDICVEVLGSGEANHKRDLEAKREDLSG